MADLLRYLRDAARSSQNDGRWALARSIAEIERELPESVRATIERKIERLDERDRQLLVAAASRVTSSTPPIVADAHRRDPPTWKSSSTTLVRVHAMIRMVEDRELPDRTLSVRYRFVHVLYQNALYASLQPTRRASLSGKVAAVDGHARRATRIARWRSELAMLFETAPQLPAAPPPTSSRRRSMPPGCSRFRKRSCWRAAASTMVEDDAGRPGTGRAGAGTADGPRPLAALGRGMGRDRAREDLHAVSQHLPGARQPAAAVPRDVGTDDVLRHPRRPARLQAVRGAAAAAGRGNRLGRVPGRRAPDGRLGQRVPRQYDHLQRALRGSRASLRAAAGTALHRDLRPRSRRHRARPLAEAALVPRTGGPGDAPHRGHGRHGPAAAPADQPRVRRLSGLEHPAPARRVPRRPSRMPTTRSRCAASTGWRRNWSGDAASAAWRWRMSAGSTKPSRNCATACRRSAGSARGFCAACG